MFARPNSPKLLAQRDITHDGDIYFWTSCIIYVTTVETVQTILTSVVVKTHPPNLAQNPRPTTPPPTQQQHHNQLQQIQYLHYPIISIITMQQFYL